MDYYSSYKKVNTPRTADPDILKRINKLKDEYDISPNALSFLSSLLVGYKKYGGITKKQYDAFCEIEKNYLHANSDLDATWFENYDDLKRETTKICALYYCANKNNIEKRIQNSPNYRFIEGNLKLLLIFFSSFCFENGKNGCFFALLFSI